ncbi:hypothetical protein LEP1GSC120_2990 [Leptospira santarosai str. 200702252]|nr:hypothetical protein LEP1GSC130_3857 [Leptospira santarosai str. 200403458]EMO99266.1 hypothetical protein LEP1GSC120_2990 [Leptospira santarosai str. 200702252]
MPELLPPWTQPMLPSIKMEKEKRVLTDTFMAKTTYHKAFHKNRV